MMLPLNYHRITATVLLLAVGFLGSFQALAQRIEPGQFSSGKVTSVIDGDTYVVKRAGGRTVTVHLWAADAPETGQPYGTTATQAVRQSVAGDSVEVVVKKVGGVIIEGGMRVDRFYRQRGEMLVRLKTDGMDIGEHLAEKGLAWWNRERAPDAEGIGDAVKAARAASRRLWSQQDPVPPWEFRARTGTSGSTAIDCSDFPNRKAARLFAEQAFDFHALDRDGDGTICEPFSELTDLALLSHGAEAEVQYAGTTATAPQAAPRAIDGDSSTAWTNVEDAPPKSLKITLPNPHSIESVTVRLGPHALDYRIDFLQTREDEDKWVTAVKRVRHRGRTTRTYAADVIRGFPPMPKTPEPTRSLRIVFLGADDTSKNPRQYAVREVRIHSAHAQN